MGHIPDSLNRAARLHGWSTNGGNSLDYFNHRFTRPEPEGRESVLRVRVSASRIVEAQAEIGGLRQSFTLPTVSRLVELMQSRPPQPVANHPASDRCGHDLTALAAAMHDWDIGLDRHGYALAHAAGKLLGKDEGDEGDGDGRGFSGPAGGGGGAGS